MKADQSIEILAKNGKSFYFAAVMLPVEKLQNISELYRFCRYVDDCADELSPDESLKAISKIKHTLNHPELLSDLQTEILGLEEKGVSRRHLLELVLGAEFDVNLNTVNTEADLDKYCYHVAGVVGLMMNPLMGVKDPEAYPFAVSLGKAMQLTNICRDILEDAQNQRQYLPMEELNATNLNLDQMSKSGPTPEALKILIKKYLEKANNYYRKGYQGLPYIPLNCRFVILLAAEIYRSIGLKIIKNNYEVLSGRTYLSGFEKALVLLKTLPRVFYFGFWIKKKTNLTPESAL